MPGWSWESPLFHLLRRASPRPPGTCLNESNPKRQEGLQGIECYRCGVSGAHAGPSACQALAAKDSEDMAPAPRSGGKDRQTSSRPSPSPQEDGFLKPCTQESCRFHGPSAQLEFPEHLLRVGSRVLSRKVLAQGLGESLRICGRTVWPGSVAASPTRLAHGHLGQPGAFCPEPILIFFKEFIYF